MARHLNIPSNGDHILVVESDHDLRLTLTELIAEETSYPTVGAFDVFEASSSVGKSKPALLVFGLNLLLGRPTVSPMPLDEYLSMPEYWPQWANAIDLYDHLCKYGDGKDVPAIILIFSRFDYREAVSRGIARCKASDLVTLLQLIRESLVPRHGTGSAVSDGKSPRHAHSFPKGTVDYALETQESRIELRAA